MVTVLVLRNDRGRLSGGLDKVIVWNITVEARLFVCSSA
jgi:hypothetical protein